jgi:Flp pilus assembly protein TadD
MRILILGSVIALAACAEQSVPRQMYTNATGYTCYTDAMRDLDTQMTVKR